MSENRLSQVQATRVVNTSRSGSKSQGCTAKKKLIPAQLLLQHNPTPSGKALRWPIPASTHSLCITLCCEWCFLKPKYHCDHFYSILCRGVWNHCAAFRPLRSFQIPKSFKLGLLDLISCLSGACSYAPHQQPLALWNTGLISKWIPA